MHGTQKPKTRGIPIYKIQSKNGRGFGACATNPDNTPENMCPMDFRKCGYSPPDETHGSPTYKPKAWTEERQK
jgi:hypothetical protein